jgi:hypothetical protein
MWLGTTPKQGPHPHSSKPNHQSFIHRSYVMAERLDPSELVNFKELLMANSMQVDAIAQLLIEKGVFTKEEFFDMLKQVQMEYRSKDNA